MGMDVIGKAPTNKAGEYFRANVWYWHPLWAYVEEVHPYYAAKVEHAHTNDGDGLNAKDAMELSRLIKRDIDNGKVAEYIFNRDQELNNMSDVRCKICDGNGTRTDKIAVEGGFAHPKLCNGCEGKGVTRPAATWYHMDLDTMREFAEFLCHCGGFEIW